MGWPWTIRAPRQGIFLSPLEEQSSLLFNFVFKMFSVGAASLPEGGMGEVPKQIAADLPEGVYRECLRRDRHWRKWCQK